jgi:hypothetical protein
MFNVAGKEKRYAFFSQSSRFVLYYLFFLPFHFVLYEIAIMEDPPETRPETLELGTFTTNSRQELSAGGFLLL